MKANKSLVMQWRWAHRI